MAQYQKRQLVVRALPNNSNLSSEWSRSYIVYIYPVVAWYRAGLKNDRNDYASVLIQCCVVIPEEKLVSQKWSQNSFLFFLSCSSRSCGTDKVPARSWRRHRAAGPLRRHAAALRRADVWASSSSSAATSATAAAADASRWRRRQ